MEVIASLEGRIRDLEAQLGKLGDGGGSAEEGGAAPGGAKRSQKRFGFF